jgi:hypothetical protein
MVPGAQNVNVARANQVFNAEHQTINNIYNITSVEHITAHTDWISKHKGNFFLPSIL